MPNLACGGVNILAKKLLWVDFLPLALYKMIAIYFLHKVILGKWSTCTIIWLRTLLSQTDCGVHYLCRTLHVEECTFWQQRYYELIYTSLALYKTIYIQFLHKVSNTWKVIYYMHNGMIEMIENTNPDRGVHYSFQTMHMCIGECIHFGKKGIMSWFYVFGST